MITLIAVVLLLECLLTSCKTVESASSNSASRPDSYYNERISSYNKEEDKLRGGESIDSMGLRPSDIVFGKDRELFHASIDLRWLFESLSNRKTWIRLANRIIHNVRRISNSYDIHSNYIRSAVKIIMEIRRFHPDCPLRIFNGKIKEAERVSLNTKKFILFYIEEDLSTEEGIAPSVETVGYKRAFSDTALSWLINNKFIMMATTSTHPYGKIVAKQLEEKGIPVSYPLFAVFAPKFVEPDAKNQINANSNFHGEDTEFVGSITGVDTSTDEMLIRRVSNNSKDKGSLLVDGTNSNSKSRAMVRTKPTQFRKTNTDTSDATQKLKQQRKKRVPVFEIIANLRLSGSEIEPGRLIEVLRKIISVHSSRFDDDENSDLSRTLIVTNKPPNRRDNEILTTTSNSDEGNEDNEDNDNSSNSDEAESKKYDDDEIDIRKYFNDHEDTLATNFSSPE